MKKPNTQYQRPANSAAMIFGVYISAQSQVLKIDRKSSEIGLCV